MLTHLACQRGTASERRKLRLENEMIKWQRLCGNDLETHAHLTKWQTNAHDHTERQSQLEADCQEPFWLVIVFHFSRWHSAFGKLVVTCPVSAHVRQLVSCRTNDLSSHKTRTKRSEQKMTTTMTTTTTTTTMLHPEYIFLNVKWWGQTFWYFPEGNRLFQSRRSGKWRPSRLSQQTEQNETKSKWVGDLKRMNDLLNAISFSFSVDHQARLKLKSNDASLIYLLFKANDRSFFYVFHMHLHVLFYDNIDYNLF